MNLACALNCQSGETNKIVQSFSSKRFYMLLNEEISLTENMKHIKFLENANYRIKILKHVERNIYKCTTEAFNFA